MSAKYSKKYLTSFILLLFLLSINFELLFSHRITSAISQSTGKTIRYDTLNDIPMTTPSPLAVKKNTQSFSGKGDIILQAVTINNSFIMKGENTQLTIAIKSLKRVEQIGLTIALESIPSEYGLSYIQEQDGETEPLVLEATIDSFCDLLEPLDEIEQTVTIGPILDENNPLSSIIPLNRGTWQIKSIRISGLGIAESEYLLQEQLVINVVLNPYEHVVFTYFVHNKKEPFYNGETIRELLDKALDRLENNYRFSIKLIVITEDGNWDHPTDYLNCSQKAAHAWSYVGEKLSLKNGLWDHTRDYDLYSGFWTTTKATNGGYDLLTIFTTKTAEHLGMAALKGNWALVCSGRYDLWNYRIGPSNIDNLLQHEISHVFGALDRKGSYSIMDNEHYFNGTTFTSPCLEATHYLNSDMKIICEHASRFDGKLNPTFSSSFSYKNTLFTISEAAWERPKVAVSPNSSFTNIQLVTGLKQGNRMALYHSSSSGITWSSYDMVISLSHNASGHEIAVDSKGNLHLVWLEKSSVDPNNQWLYYRRRKSNGEWGEIISLVNNSNCIAPKIAADFSGGIHIVYESNNGSVSKISYLNNSLGNWSDSIVLSGNAETAHSPMLEINQTNHLHLMWCENNNSQINIYHSIGNLTGYFSQKSLIVNINATDFLSNIHFAFSHDGEQIHLIWLEEFEDKNVLRYQHQYLNGTVIITSTISDLDREEIIQNPALAVRNDGTVYLCWENLHKSGNKTYLLYRVKSSSGLWSKINRLSPFCVSYHTPVFLQDNGNNLHLFYAYSDAESYATIYSTVYGQEILNYHHNIFVEQFNITSFSEVSPDVYHFELSNIIAFSNNSNIGLLDSEIETIFHKYGFWRVDDGYPLLTDDLVLNPYSDTWSASNILALTPGKYYAGVAFMTNDYVYTGNVLSNNSVIIEAPEINIPSQPPKALIWSLATGIPAIILIAITTFTLAIKKKEK